MKNSKISWDKDAYIYLMQWLFLSISAGLIGCMVMHSFIWLVQKILYSLSTTPIPIYLWPLAGALVVSGIIYRLEPRARGEGIPSFLIGVREHDGYLSSRESLFKFIAALLTLGTLGNGGFLGPGGRVTAGLTSLLRRVIPRKIIPRDEDSLFAICGLAAAFGVLFHSPIGGGIFAVEIIQKRNMAYKKLFPSILASTSGVFFSRLFGFQMPIHFPAAQGHMDIRLAGLVVLTALLAGLTGRLFIMLYQRISMLFHRDVLHLPHLGIMVRALIGSMLAFGVIYFINPELLGTSQGIFKALLSAEEGLLRGNMPDKVPFFLILLLLMLLKALANCLTVGSGMSAGFAGPAMLIGLLLGAASADLFQIPAHSPEYFALLAAGFAGVFSSTMNTPLATGVLTIEVFGLFYSLPAALASVIGFQINRHNTLYDTVLDELRSEEQ